MAIKCEVQEEDHVLVLTDSNFSQEIEKHEKILVEFYAPWCGHCRELAPEYSGAAQQMKDWNPRFYLAKVDATQETKLAEKFSIQGFPTLIFFTNYGKDRTDYNGGRTAEEIISWISKKVGPLAKELTTVEELNQFREAHEAAAVYFEANTTSAYTSFEKVADRINEVGFAFTNKADLLVEAKAQLGQVVVFKKFDNGRATYEGDLNNVDELTKFVENNSHPLVMYFDDRTAEFIFGKSKSAVFLYRNPQKHSELEKVMAEVAPQIKDHLHTIVTGIEDEMEEKLAEYIGVTEENLPVLKIHHVTEDDVLTYTLKEEITAENILKFVQDYNDKKLEPEYKSEPIPEPNPNEAVKTIVRNNFDQVVMDPTKDVLVEFYAPWCGHCKSLAPKYENVAQALKSYENLILAKIDATANDTPGLNIEGFPTLMFFSGKNKTPVTFEGDRTENSIIEFLKKHTTQVKIDKYEITPLPDEPEEEEPQETDEDGNITTEEEPETEGVEDEKEDL